jgi:hypothetical protein
MSASEDPERTSRCFALGAEIKNSAPEFRANNSNRLARAEIRCICQPMSHHGTFRMWRWCTGMSVSEDRADNNMKRSNVCRWCLPRPDCHRRRRRTFRNYRENCRARDHRPGRDRIRSSRWFSGGSEQPDDDCDAWRHKCWLELPVVLGRLKCCDCSEGPTHHSSPHLTQR